jgi:hypothetical protein
MTPVTNDNGCLSVIVDPGACRFKSRVTACFDEGGVRIDVTSDCPHVNLLAQRLTDLHLQPFDALKMPWNANVVYLECGRVLKHATCPLPLAILKCIEAATGLAVQKDVSIKFERPPR